MRFTVGITGPRAWVVVAALLGTPTYAAAISLTDYRFPESTSQQAYLSGLFSTKDNDEAGQVAYTVNGSGSYDFFHRSLPLSWEFRSFATATVARPDTQGIDQRGSYDLVATSRANKYFRETSNKFSYGRTRFEFRALPDDPPFDPYWDFAVGLGAGRTIDATVLKQALRLQEDFLQYGVITNVIPDPALLELAGIIDRESEYETRYGPREYKKYWYEEMEEVIRQSGVLRPEGLGAMGTIRIEEVLEREPTGRRFYGSEARVGVGLVVSDFAGNQGDPILEAAFDWARPGGLQLQFTDNASATITFAGDTYYTLLNVFQLYYEVANRIDWDNRLRTQYDIPTGSGVDNIFNLQFSSTYIFYIENRLTFDPGFAYNYVDRGSGGDSWDWTFSGSITYRLR